MQLKRGCNGIWIAAATAALDRISKAAAQRLTPGEVVRLIPGVVHLRPTANTGMAFSLFSDSGGLLTIVTLALVLGLTAWLVVRPQAQTKWMRAGLWMVIGGGFGNVYDRVVYGHVIDFIEPAFIRFAIFNVADIFICIGVAITAAAMIHDEWKKEHAHGRADH